ncbi:NADP-dependent oxidoreductase [Kitasatospora aureofaciens]|uniref:NADP-dependent oxidoreductase n=1 Tax=Kitasatospora aureofaciens TaxID=1894 RepID=A0A1E7NAA6_KITAU|nr:NADP-dependent oxidoreductase [Kitasatospora aureofaciens]ARF79865.1 NADP-dependent oxidoreductase [Kitasatospora aureofaciens]OEV37612.1 NADP-dependent oxidoreductase [Kitasatospora aureofaciens]GGU86310.1 NADP-dependent oxidoreductase [Kitasatospora aureofaciens]
MSRPTARVVHLVSRPSGAPSAENFAFVDEPVPALVAGEALVENLYQSVDPYMREEMEEGGWELHAPLEGRTLGRVVETRADTLPVGTLVFHRQAWRTHSVVTAERAHLLPDFAGVPLSAHLSVLGGTGLSAWVGLTRIARLRPDETLFVSAAAGGVGTAAGRIARLLGAGLVIGSTGSAAKAAHLTEHLGFDAAFDYHDGPIADRLREAAPDGLHVYLDNVGGDHLEGAISAMRDRGRIAWCGAVAQYNNLQDPPAAPRNLYDVVGKNLRLEGFLVRDHLDARPELYDFLVPHLRSGALVPDETVVDGFDRVVEAFLGMLRGANTGKMIVRI